MKLIVFLGIALCVLSQTNDFTLSIKLQNQQWQKVGELKVTKQNFQNSQIILDNKATQIIDLKTAIAANSAILKLENNKGLELLTYIDGKQLQLFNQKANYFEIISLFVSNNELNAFDYTLKPVRKQLEANVQVVIKDVEIAPSGIVPQFDEKLPEEIEQQKKPQGIFGLIMEYKWYIIIGFVVIFMLQQADPQKLNETVQQAQQQAQQASRRQKK